MSAATSEAVAKEIALTESLSATPPRALVTRMAVLTTAQKAAKMSSPRYVSSSGLTVARRSVAAIGVIAAPHPICPSHEGASSAVLRGENQRWATNVGRIAVSTTRHS